MNATLAKNVDHEIGCRIDDFGLIGESGDAGHKPCEFHDAADAFKVAVEGRLELGDDIDGALARCGAGFVKADISSGQSGMEKLSVCKGATGQR